MANDFYEQLAWSEKSSDEDFWSSIYKKAFPDMAFHTLNTAGKSLSQNLGIDRIIHLKSGKTLYVDEKKRKKKWGDILLEYKSNSNSSKNDGWINKQLHIDYLAYAFMETREVYLFDWQTLRRVWKENGKKWFKIYKTIQAKNEHYTTYSLAIPIDIIMQKMNVSIVIKEVA